MLQLCICLQLGAQNCAHYDTHCTGRKVKSLIRIGKCIVRNQLFYSNVLNKNGVFQKRNEKIKMFVHQYLFYHCYLNLSGFVSIYSWLSKQYFNYYYYFPNTVTISKLKYYTYPLSKKINLNGLVSKPREPN